MVAYIDSDWTGSVTNQKSSSGCFFTLGSVVIAWCSRKQMSVVLSMGEEKYIDMFSACSKVAWLQKFLSRLFNLKLDVTCIFCDN